MKKHVRLYVIFSFSYFLISFQSFFHCLPVAKMQSKSSTKKRPAAGSRQKLPKDIVFDDDTSDSSDDEVAVNNFQNSLQKRLSSGRQVQEDSDSEDDFDEDDDDEDTDESTTEAEDKNADKVSLVNKAINAKIADFKASLDSLKKMKEKESDNDDEEEEDETEEEASEGEKEEGEESEENDSEEESDGVEDETAPQPAKKRRVEEESVPLKKNTQKPTASEISDEETEGEEEETKENEAETRVRKFVWRLKRKPNFTNFHVLFLENHSWRAQRNVDPGTSENEGEDRPQAVQQNDWGGRKAARPNEEGSKRGIQAREQKSAPWNVFEESCG